MEYALGGLFGLLIAGAACAWWRRRRNGESVTPHHIGKMSSAMQRYEGQLAAHERRLRALEKR